MPIPEPLQRVLDEAVALVRAHPTHELGQNKRREIYELLRSLAPYGEQARKWLAILSAQRVQPLYQQIVSQIDWKVSTEVIQEEEQLLEEMVKQRIAEGDEAAKEWLVPLENMAQRVIKIAEDVMTGVIALEYAKAASSDTFYHTMAIGGHNHFPEQAYLALSAAEEALSEVLAVIPLQNRISGDLTDADGSVACIRSDRWTDEELAGAGCNAADAAVNAAYAFAGNPTRRSYDYVKVCAFWEWWLRDAILTAWNRATETKFA
jgi:hypothetical protein